MDPDIVAVTRHNPKSHQTVVLISHTCFNHGVNLDRAFTGLDLQVEGQLLLVEIEAGLIKTQEEKFEKDEKYINGLTNYEIEMRTEVKIDETKFVRLASDPQDCKVRIELNNFKPGSIVAFRFQLNQGQNDACLGLQKLLQEPKKLHEIVQKLTLSDLNHVLFKCDQEEHDDIGSGVYSLEGYGPLKYAGLQGRHS